MNNPPYFTGNNYKEGGWEFDVDETVGDSTDNVYIGQVEAADKDKDTITFKLIDNVGLDAREFYIEKDGKIWKKGPFDYETKRLYFFDVEITDGDYVTSSNGGVNILIVDKNDHTPVFKQDEYEAKLPEDTEKDDAILTVQASDNDATNKNNVLRFTITDGNDAKRFAVDAVSGKLTLADKLDYEGTKK